MLVYLGHEFAQKSPVGVHRVAAERGCFGLGDVLGDVAMSLGGGFGEGGAGGEAGMGEAALGVHAQHRLSHRFQNLAGLIDDEFQAFVQRLEGIVGDDGGDFHDAVGVFVQASHLHVYPAEHLKQASQSARSSRKKAAAGCYKLLLAAIDAPAG